MKKKLRIAWRLLRCRVSRQMIYRASFWTALFVDITVFGIQVLTFMVIFSQIDTIGGWTLGHMLIFLGTFTLLDGLYMSTYFFGVIAIPEKIRSGALDLYLTKPINGLFLLSVESMDLGSILLAIPGFLMIGWGVRDLGITLTLGRVLGYALLFGMMFLLMYSVTVLMRIPAFWLVRINAFSELENALVEFSFRVPGVVFRGVWKVLLYGILPYGLMATLPAQFLTGGLPWQLWLLAGGVLAVFWVMMNLLWQRGVRRYGSASS